MEDLLLFEILNTIKEGNSNGYITVRNEVLAKESFIGLNEQDYKTSFDKLVTNKCLEQYRNESTNYITAYRITTDKDCWTHYKNQLEAKRQETTDKKEIETLNRRVSEMTADKLQYEQTIRDLQSSLTTAQLKDIPINAEDRKTVVQWTVAQGVIVIVSFLLGLFAGWKWL